MAESRLARMQAVMDESTEPGVKCKACDHLAAMEPDERRVVEAWFDDTSRAGSWIQRALIAGGFPISESVVRRHRNGHA